MRRLCALLLLAKICAFAYPEAVEERIKQIESSLMQGAYLSGTSPKVGSLEERMAYYNVPGVSIAVISEGKIEWARGYGVLAAGEIPKVTTRTLFQAGSISKPVAALGAMLQVQEGKVGLDQNINQALVSWKLTENAYTKQQPVTLRRLLSHMACVSIHGFTGYKKDEKLPTLLQILNGQPPAHNQRIQVTCVPGTKVQYSGGGMEIVQQLVSDLAQQPFPRYMRNVLFEKSGMLTSTFDQPLPLGWQNWASAGHQADGTMIQGRWYLYPEVAAAGLWSHPTDLARFLLLVQKAYRGSPDQLIKPETAKEMLKAQNRLFGLGFMIKSDGKEIRYGHSGRNQGYSAEAWAYVQRGKGVVVMVNRDECDSFLYEIIRSIATVYDWPDFHPVEKKIYQSFDSNCADVFTGLYIAGEDTTPSLEILLDGNKLFAKNLRTQECLRLYPESQVQFFTLDQGASYLFAQGESITGVSLTMTTDLTEISLTKSAPTPGSKPLPSADRKGQSEADQETGSSE